MQIIINQESVYGLTLNQWQQINQMSFFLSRNTAIWLILEKTIPCAEYLSATLMNEFGIWFVARISHRLFDVAEASRNRDSMSDNEVDF